MFKWIQSSSSSSKPGPSHATPAPSNAAPLSGTTAVSSEATITNAGPPLPEGPDGKRFGMENFGNTCYANSVLQALYFCQPFRDLLIANYEASSQPITPSIGTSLPPVPVPNASPAKRPITKPEDASTPAAMPAGPPIPPNPSSLYMALRSLFYHIATNPNPKGVVAPQAFVTKLKKENVLFRSSMHQDAHEFLNYLLNKIVEDLEEEGKGDIMGTSISSMATSTSTSTAPSATSLSGSPPPQPAPLIQSLFQGTLTNETRCLTCERVTSRSEPFLDLSLDISQNTSVNACLRHFSKSEMLTARNKFFCDECCGLVEAEKRMKIKSLPPILLLHLKRFKYQEDLQKYIKLSYRVAFPMELRLYNNTVDPTSADASSEGRGRRKGHYDFRGATDENGVPSEVKGAGSGGPGDPEALYKLFAVVVHIGGGPHQGHYITLVKTEVSWLLFDDDSVEPIKETDIPKYFGDSSFTVEAAVNHANAAAAAAASAPVTTVSTPIAIAGVAGMAGGFVSSAKVLSANPAPSATASAPANKQPVSSSQLPGAAPSAAPGAPAQPNALSGTGSGYVLLYQSANIDLKALGLVTAAAKQAKEVGTAILSEAAISEVYTTDAGPTLAGSQTASSSSSLEPPAAHVAVEHPEDDDELLKPERSVTGKSSPSFVSSSPATSSPMVQPISPVLAPATTLTAGLSTGAPSYTESTSATTTSNDHKDRSPKHALSLEMPSSPAAPAAALEDQLSPLVLPPSVVAAPSPQPNGGFFKSLKHSASAKVERTPSAGLAGFGLGLSSPTPLPPKEKGQAQPTRPVLGSHAAASTPLLPTRGHPNGDTTLVVPPLPPLPPIPTKEKEREKEKEKSHWYSTARMSIKRRSRNKEKDKDGKESDTALGTTTSSSSGTQPSLPKNDTNGFGGWIGGSGVLSGGWVGVDGGTLGPLSSAGAIPPGVRASQDERRSSEPTAPSDASLDTPAAARPQSMVEAIAAPLRKPPPLAPTKPKEHRQRRPQTSPTQPTFPRTEANSMTQSPSLPRSESPAQRLSPRIPRSRPSSSSGSVPSSPTIPSAKNGKFHQPRKSLTMFDPITPPPFSVGESPIPRENLPTLLHKDDGLMKRASRKMSLNTSTIRISGFGWNKDKDKDHR